MINIEEIRQYFKIFRGLGFQDLLKIESLRNRKLFVSDFYIKEGEVTKKIAYIKKGLIRVFTIKENGDEITLMLLWENQLVASHDNIILNQPSRFYFQALEETELIELDYDELEKFLKKKPEFELIRNHLSLKLIQILLNKTESFVLLTPEERYIRFLSETPNIFNRVPDKYIANVIGITPVSLSRIRKRIASRKKH